MNEDMVMKVCENLAERILCDTIDSKELYRTEYGSKTVRGVANMIYNDFRNMETIKCTKED